MWLVSVHENDITNNSLHTYLRLPLAAALLHCSRNQSPLSANTTIYAESRWTYLGIARLARKETQIIYIPVCVPLILGRHLLRSLCLDFT